MGYKAVFTSFEKKNLFALLCENGDLYKINFDIKQSQLMDKVFVGRVANKLQNLNACFVEYEKGKMGYLDYKAEKESKYKNESKLLVKVVKEPIKTKEATLSDEITIGGIYCIVSNKKGDLHFSKKIRKDKKEELLLALTSVDRHGYSCVIRTNALSLDLNLDRDKITEEMTRLVNEMDEVLIKADSRSLYSKIYDGKPFLISQLEELDFHLMDEFVTDDEAVYSQLKNILPASFHEKIRFYQDEYPLFSLYSLRGKISNLLKRKYYLKSGGYLIIDKTEAMTVIDVNSGQNTKKMSKKELIKITNKEALEAIATILPSANYTGMILVDFLNCESKTEEEYLLSKMSGLFKDDHIKTDVLDITKLGLMEITRQKNGYSLQKQLKEVDLIEAFKD